MDKHKEYTWHSKRAVDHYVEVADILLPNRQAILSIIAKATRKFSSDGVRILDMGCGNGDVTAEVLRYVPDAHVCMIDLKEIKISEFYNTI